MLLEYGALIALIYMSLFAPIIGGIIWMFRQKKTWMFFLGMLTLIATAFIVVTIFII